MSHLNQVRTRKSKDRSLGEKVVSTRIIKKLFTFFTWVNLPAVTTGVDDWPIPTTESAPETDRVGL